MNSVLSPNSGIRKAITANGKNIASKGAVVVFVIAALLVIVAIIVFIVYRIKRSDLKSIVLLAGTRNLMEQTTPLRVPSSKLPPTVNGQEFSYSFWLYLTDYQPTAAHKLLMLRSGNGAIKGAHPAVFLDARTNKMYIVARTSTSTTVTTLTDMLDKTQNKHVVAVIEYVPLQRWVNVVFVQQDNLLTVYMDGDMYTVENVHDLYNPVLSSDRPIFSGQSGDVMVGAVATTSRTSGFISRVQYYNYGLTQNNVKNLYAKGPVDSSVLSSFGISEYGIRTPVYRVNQ